MNQGNWYGNAPLPPSLEYQIKMRIAEIKRTLLSVPDLEKELAALEAYEAARK